MVAPSRTAAALLFYVASAAAFSLAPLRYAPQLPVDQCPLLQHQPLHGSRAAVIRAAADGDDAAADSDKKEDNEADFKPEDIAKLSQRIATIQQNGLATPAQKLFELATNKSPQALMQDFFRTSSPEVVDAMRDAVVSLLGTLPPFEFEAQISTTGDRLASLMLQLQMTGYMLRNAEYVMTLRKLLQLKGRSMEEYREAFDRIDLDKSGFIETSEVEKLLADVYKGEVPPAFEVDAFVTLFDADGDGKISWEEFAAALGAMDDSTSRKAMPLLEGSGEPTPSPSLEGTIRVMLDDGNEVEMDAAAYMEQLQEEASALRKELGQVEAAAAKKEDSVSTSLTAYVSSLPESQLKLLSTGISDDVVTAMKDLVSYILRAPSGDGPLEKDAAVTLEQAKMQQLCLYQLILGYRLREAEATGEASESIGR